MSLAIPESELGLPHIFDHGLDIPSDLDVYTGKVSSNLLLKHVVEDVLRIRDAFCILDPRLIEELVFAQG